MTTQSKALAEGASCSMQMTALSATECASKLALTLHELLSAMGETALSQLAWVAHLEASRSAEMLGESLGIEVSI